MHTVSIGLGGRSKLQYVTGKLKKPVPVNPNFFMIQEKKTLKEWITDDLPVRNWLLNSTELAITDIYMCAGADWAIWEKLEKVMVKKITMQESFNSKLKFIKQNNNQDNQSQNC
jgi:hypothetical protein